MSSECSFSDDDGWVVSAREITVHDNYDDPESFFLELNWRGCDSVGARLTGPEVCQLFDVVSDAYMAYCESLEAETVVVPLSGSEVEALVLGELTAEQSLTLFKRLCSGLPVKTVDRVRSKSANWVDPISCCDEPDVDDCCAPCSAGDDCEKSCETEAVDFEGLVGQVEAMFGKLPPFDAILGRESKPKSLKESMLDALEGFAEGLEDLAARLDAESKNKASES